MYPDFASLQSVLPQIIKKASASLQGGAVEALNVLHIGFATHCNNEVGDRCNCHSDPQSCLPPLIATTVMNYRMSSSLSPLQPDFDRYFEFADFTTLLLLRPLPTHTLLYNPFPLLTFILSPYPSHLYFVTFFLFRMRVAHSLRHL